MIDSRVKHAHRGGGWDLSTFLPGAGALAASRGRARRTLAVARLAAKLASEDGMGRFRALSYAGTLTLGPRGLRR